MITSELVSYIKKQIQNNISKDLIITKLVSAGWHLEDIDEAFSDIEKEPKQKTPEVKKISETSNISNSNSNSAFADKYHEPIEGDNLFEVKMEPHRAEVKELVEEKVEAPILQVQAQPEPKIEPTIEQVASMLEQKFETPNIRTEIPAVVQQPVIAEAILETPVVEVPTEVVKEAPIIDENPKIWTPMGLPIKVKTHTEENNNKVKEDEEVSVQYVELPSRNENKMEQFKIKEVPSKPAPVIDHKILSKNDDLIPHLVPKPMVNSFGSVSKKVEIKKPETIVAPVATPTEESPVKSLSKMAMLSSYKSDLMSVNRGLDQIVKPKKNKVTRWVIFMAVLIILALTAWGVVSGFINLKNINLPFVKKDPKVLLLNNSKVLSSLKSYKTETNIEVSSPSFSNITYGLVSGEAVTSPDKDSFSINTLGIINQNDKGLQADNFVTIKSSLLQDYITTDIKNDGTNLYVSVPDLSSIIKDSAPESSIVKINKQQFDLIPSLFSSGIETELKKVNIYEILSNGMPSFVNNDTLNAYNDFINNVEIAEKGEENIKGINTYHYSINPDRQLTKKLLTVISNKFVSNLSDSDKDRLSQIVSSASVHSFDVWIGKDDNNIYQYNVVLDIPLSKIIGFEDKSIGDNIINISWKTTYYDFNISNNILMPDTSTSVNDFVNTIKELKMKKEVSSIKQMAANLLKSDGGYGKTSNVSGSCMNPTSGSLFSPIGHAKGATTAVSSISQLLNNILGTTNGAGYCYSNPKAWSFSIPISDNYDPATVASTGYQHYFCIDNTGTSIDLITPQTGVICK